MKKTSTASAHARAVIRTRINWERMMITDDAKVRRPSSRLLARGQLLLERAYRKQLDDPHGPEGQAISRELMRTLRSASLSERDVLYAEYEAGIPNIVWGRQDQVLSSATLRAAETTLYAILLQAQALARELDLIELEALQRRPISFAA